MTHPVKLPGLHEQLSHHTTLHTADRQLCGLHQDWFGYRGGHSGMNSARRSAQPGHRNRTTTTNAVL